MSTQMENVVGQEHPTSPAKEEATTQHKMGIAEVYKALAASDIESLKERTQVQLDTFVSPVAENTILHIYIISQSSPEKERTKVQKLQSCLKSMAGRSQETIVAPPSKAEIVRRMLEEWPSLPWKANGKKDIPLHVAARHGHDDIVQALIDHAKNNPDAAGEREEDVEAGHTLPQRSVWKMLHETNADKETALHQAVRYGHSNAAQVLIAEDDPSFSYFANKDDETPLYMAAERYNTFVIYLILEHYETPAYEGPNGRNALHAATFGWYWHGKSIVLEKKWLEILITKVDDKGQTPRHCNPHLCFSLKYKCISAIFMRDKDGNTPLHIAAREGCCSAVDVFIEHCPECFELVDQQGRNALHLAVKSGKKRVVDLILENKFLSDLLKQKDNNGNTPLHLLATSPNYWPDVIKDPRFDTMAFNKDNLNPLGALESNKLTLSKKERRMRRCFWEANIYPGNRIVTNSDSMNVSQYGGLNQACGNNGSDEDNLKDERQNQLVVAALIATVTFAAGFTLPGGYIQEKGPDQGYAVLTKNAAFIIFVISDSIGLVFSCAAVFIHLLIAMDDYKEKETVRKLFEKALPLTLFATVAMVIAFITGTFAVLAHSPSLAVSASVIGGVFFFLLGHLVEEAREPTSFPIFRWIIDGVTWLLIVVVLVLDELLLFCYFTLEHVKESINKNQNSAQGHTFEGTEKKIKEQRHSSEVDKSTTH